jgi:hypothetical protein
MHARYYAPMWGRFLSVDPILDLAAVIEQPQGWNRYSYGANNPIRFIDPDGRAVVSYKVLDSGPNHVSNLPRGEQAKNVQVLGLENQPRGFYLKTNVAIAFDEGDNLADYRVERSVKFDTGITRDLGPGSPRIGFRKGSEENPHKSQIADLGQTKYVYDSPGLSGMVKAIGNGTWRGVFEVKVYNTKTKTYDAKRFYYAVQIKYENGTATAGQAVEIDKETYCKSVGKCD